MNLVITALTDRLLNFAVIEGSFNFFLAPQTALDETAARDAVDFDVFMVVLNPEQKPVFIVEIKADTWANKPDKRQRANTQTHQRFDQMLPNCAIPRLYGLSLLGTSLRIYCGDKVTGGRPDVDRVLPPDFLEGQWDLDILSLDGLKKTQEIVA